MRWIVDGYNVIRRDPDLAGAEASGLEPGRAALLRVVIGAAQRTGDPFTVVFDGAPGHVAPGGSGQIDLVFSRPPETADDVVVALARRLGQGAIVVTSDRTVGDAARRAGATILSAEQFVTAARVAYVADEPETAEDDEEEDDVRDRGKRGNPRRRSAEERAIERALRRLRSGRGPAQ
jgi:predicted RNA-binding protein with PIN domain